MIRPRRRQVGAIVAIALGFGCLAGIPAAAAPVSGSSSSVFLFGTGPGPEPVALVSVPVKVAGGLLVRFHGDPGTGCAARGLCGYAGAVSWTPARAGELDVLESRSHGHLLYGANLDLFDPFGSSGMTRSQVSLTPAGSAPATVCADAVPGDSAIALPNHGRQLSFALIAPAQGILQTRCAGPLISDLVSAVPAIRLSVSAVLRGHLALNRTGSWSFASHGFAGTIDSTLTLRLGQPRRSALQVSPQPGSRRGREREVAITYRAHLSGTVTERLSAIAATEVCAPLGACGTTGTQTLRPDVTRALSFTATGSARRPYRDFLAALGLAGTGRASGISTFSYTSWNGGGTLSAELLQGGAVCQDTVALGAGLLQMSARGRRLLIAYQPASTPGLAATRTRCPGPLGSSSAGTTPVASASIPLRDLSARRLTIRFTRPFGLADDGYTVRSVPDLTLTLVRRAVTSHSFTTFSSPGSGSSSSGFFFYGG